MAQKNFSDVNNTTWPQHHLFRYMWVLQGKVSDKFVFGSLDLFSRWLMSTLCISLWTKKNCEIIYPASPNSVCGFFMDVNNTLRCSNMCPINVNVCIIHQAVLLGFFGFLVFYVGGGGGGMNFSRQRTSFLCNCTTKTFSSTFQRQFVSFWVSLGC